MITLKDVERAYARYKAGERPWPQRRSTWHVVMADRHKGDGGG